MEFSRLWLSSLVIAASVLLVACQTAPTPATGKATARDVVAQSIANNCFACHGPGGHSPGAIPSLDRLSAQAIANRMKGFKNQTEPSTVMGRHAKAYTDAEIEAVANYIASLKR